MTSPRAAASEVEDDLGLRVPVARAALAYLGVTLASVAIAALLLVRFAGVGALGNAAKAPHAGPTLGLLEQALFVAPPTEGGARGLTLLRDQQAALGHYAWVDRERGVVRIPIERAIDLLVAGDGGAGLLPAEAGGVPSP